MSSNLIEILKRTAFYNSMLEQVPEAEREAAVAALITQLRPYESLCASIPPGALEKLVSSMNLEKVQEELVKAEGARRAPRRF